MTKHAETPSTFAARREQLSRALAESIVADAKSSDADVADARAHLRGDSSGFTYPNIVARLSEREIDALRFLHGKIDGTLSARTPQLGERLLVVPQHGVRCPRCGEQLRARDFSADVGDGPGKYAPNATASNATASA